MNDELLKKLKDNGFPFIAQNIDNGVTLIELIEACGICFGSLNRIAGLAWNAFSSDGTPTNLPIVTKGNSPEEAVAHLWLELQFHK